MKTQAQEKIHYHIGASPLGRVLVAHSAKGVCAVLLGDSAQELLKDLKNRFPAAALIKPDAGSKKRLAEVIAALENPSQARDVTLDLRGTDFQKRVWRTLRKIPAGKTMSYAEVARKIGAPKAVRAVGTACGANPLAVLVPCHRVLGSKETLCGYRWGIARKKRLLDREAALTDLR